MEKFISGFDLPPGMEPTITNRMRHGAYQSAKILEAVKNCELTDGAANFPGSPKCHYCLGRSPSPLKPLVCSGCRGIIYCSRKCQVADWKGKKRPHKLWCARDKEYMTRHPYFLSQIKQFPWARIETDGSFSHGIFEARLGVYGPGMNFGFWSSPGPPELHDLEELPHPKGYIHGEMVLQKQWPAVVDAWKLERMNGKRDFIPRLEFSTEFRPPARVGVGEIRDWKGWYGWRGLSMASPAALLMHYPLSVYHILVDILQVVKCTNASGERRALEVHYIGTEKELNFLPLFSELALLFPCVDLTLIFFGKPVFDLVKRARKSHQGSLATKDIVWAYTAPQETGGGSIEIKLYSKAEYWTIEVLDERKPDALIGLNAGLATYDQWVQPVQGGLSYKIPFATTDYDEQNSVYVAENIVACVDALLVATPSTEEEGVLVATPTGRTFPVMPNPFHMPGQKQVGTLKLPSLSNGFVLAVFTGDLDVKEEEEEDRV